MIAALVLFPLSRNTCAEEAIDGTTTSGIINLLVSDRAEEVFKGENSLAIRRPFVIAELLERVRNGDTIDRGQAAYELGIIISPWMRGKETSARDLSIMATPRRPVERVSQIAEGSAIRHELMVAISSLLDQSDEAHNRFYYALSALCETLGEVANDETIAWALNRLQAVQSPLRAEPMVNLVASYLGIPLVLQITSYCGMTTASARESIERTDEIAAANTVKTLAAIWQQLRPLGVRDRITFAIKSWHEESLSPFRNLTASPHEWLHQNIEPLERFGTSAVDLLRVQQSLETDAQAKGMWEAAIATITGQEDAGMVRLLLAGVGKAPNIALEIIVASGSTRWRHDLEIRLGNDGDIGTKASIALATCHGFGSIPALRKTVATCPSNGRVKLVLEQIEERVTQGPTRYMCRYWPLYH